MDDSSTIEGVLRVLDQLGTDEEGALADARKLANKYKQEKFVKLVQSLAKEHEAVESKFRARGKVELVSAPDIRVALYRTNPRAQIAGIDEASIRLVAEYPRKVSVLKAPYGYKGGAARLVLAASLGEPVWNYAPRDVDIVRVGRGSEKTDWLVAKQFMPEDMLHGAGVEAVGSVSEYLETRDATINQVIALGSELVCSYQCLEDFLNGVLAPTAHVQDESGMVQSRVLVKLLRMQAISEIEGRPMRLERIGPTPNVPDFDIALHLDRALSRGTRVAELYLRNCVAWGILSMQGAESVGDISRRLAKKAPDRTKGLKHVSATTGKRRGAKLPRGSKRSRR